MVSFCHEVLPQVTNYKKIMNQGICVCVVLKGFELTRINFQLNLC
jgi:hypothetical protein